MIIGVPKEIKNQEYRVGLIPASVRELTKLGHTVLVETEAGEGVQASDEDYKDAGASIIKTAKEVFDQADMIVKVKEPQAVECDMLREGQIIFTYLHLAADKNQTDGLIKSKSVAIAYETVTDKDGKLPLLTPMSEVAGRMAVQVGAYFLQKPNGGTGKLLSGMPGVPRANVLIIGGGVSGFNAARMAVGLGGRVTILERNVKRMKFLDEFFLSRLDVVYSTAEALDRLLPQCDLVIGAVLVPGGAAPKLLRRKHLKEMVNGAVVVDIAIDQGGCFETSRPTTHDEPVYTEEGVLHYCVTNMPGAVPHTSTYALNQSVLPYVMDIANKGWEQALKDDDHLKNGLNICLGKVTHSEVAEVFDYDHTAAETFL